MDPLRIKQGRDAEALVDSKVLTDDQMKDWTYYLEKTFGTSNLAIAHIKEKLEENLSDAAKQNYTKALTVLSDIPVGGKRRRRSKTSKKSRKNKRKTRKH